MECFTIMSNEIEGRIDPFYYKPEFRELEKKLLNEKKAIRGKDIFVKIESGIGVKPGSLRDNGLRYIEVNSISPFEISKGNSFVNENDRVKFLDKGDIVTGRVGSIGNFALVEDDEKIAYSDNVLRIKVKENVNKKYLLFLLNSQIVRKQIERYKKGSLQNVINQQTLNSLILIFPPLSVQNRIVQIMDNAYTIKKQKETEAQRLLDSINDYVLSELGIKIPELKDQMFFVVYADDVKGKRIDPYYHQPKFEEIEKAIEKGKFETAILKENIKHLSMGISVPNYKNEDNEVPFILGKNLKIGYLDLSAGLEYISRKSSEKGKNSIVEEGDVLFSVRGAY
ncbi:MAG: restriction endonuclease subunit S, partial [Candidatus Aenigmarchaeota archaeon]|nr:restriction endonuclease subunit S [Candidatus Aenigmarchaeota archaeon]